MYYTDFYLGHHWASILIIQVLDSFETYFMVCINVPVQSVPLCSTEYCTNVGHTEIAFCRRRRCSRTIQSSISRYNYKKTINKEYTVKRDYLADKIFQF